MGQHRPQPGGLPLAAVERKSLDNLAATLSDSALAFQLQRLAELPLSGKPTEEGPELAGYTIVNLMELENQAGEGGPTLDSRFARSAIESDHIGVSHFRYGPAGSAIEVTATGSKRRSTSYSAARGT